MRIIFLLMICFCWLAGWSKSELRTIREGRKASDEVPLYLPEPTLVRAVTLGFNNVTADFLWFQTVNYFGKRFRNHQDLPWFGEMCDLVTNLDPGAEHVYEFCGTLLSWLGNDPEMSARILSRAIQLHPQNWYYRYLRAFTNWYFLEKHDVALRDLRVAAGLPGAPPLIAAMASRMMLAEQDPQTAISFLKSLIENTKNKDAQTALVDRLKRAVLTRDTRQLEHAVQTFRDRKGYLPETTQNLVDEGIVFSVPPDPFGGTYIIEKDSGTVRSSSGEKGLEFFGKTARTGIASGERK